MPGLRDVAELDDHVHSAIGPGRKVAEIVRHLLVVFRGFPKSCGQEKEKHGSDDKRNDKPGTLMACPYFGFECHISFHLCVLHHLPTKRGDAGEGEGVFNSWLRAPDSGSYHLSCGLGP